MREPELKPENLPSSLAKELENGTLSLRARRSGAGGSSDEAKMSNLDLLEIIKWDVFRDLCGAEPLSGINYLSLTAMFMMQFMRIERELERLRNPVYMRVYKTDRTFRNEKRTGLVAAIMIEEDEECLGVIAQLLQDPRAGLVDNIYWGDVEDALERMGRTKSKPSMGEDPIDGDCQIM